MTVYCMKCKSSTGDKDVKEVMTSNGRRRISCMCTACGGKKSGFPSNSKVSKAPKDGESFSLG